MLNIYHYRETVEYSPGEPAPYASKDVLIYQVGTTTPAAIFSDADLTVPIANSRVTTNEFSDVEFWSSLSSVDMVRARGGGRTTHTGDPGGQDELRYTRIFALR